MYSEFFFTTFKNYVSKNGLTQAEQEEKVNYGIMRESRYIMENYLAQEPELNEKYLINGKYLKPEYLVHHINLDMLDNRLENFYLCEGASEHNKVHNSLIKLVDELLQLGLMIFDNGKYFMAHL